MNKRAFLLLKYSIWLLAICIMLIVLYKTITPTYREETQFTVGNIETPPLYPGDSVLQSFTATEDALSTFEIALSYGEQVREDCTLSIAFYRGNTFILEQPLQVNACPNRTFFLFYVEQKDCLGETFHIKITNTTNSDTREDAVAFSLLATNQKHSYLDNTQNYTFNQAPYDARLVCRFNYQTGYDYYQSLTYCFWIFLSVLMLSLGLSRLYRSKTTA